MEEYQTSVDDLIVDGFGNLYDLYNHKIINTEFISKKDKTYRARSLIVNTYIEHGRIFRWSD